jgi:hypothetical protein
MQNDEMLQVWAYFTLLLSCSKTYSSSLLFVMYLQCFFLYIKFVVFLSYLIKKAALTNFSRYRIPVLSIDYMSMPGTVLIG